MVSSNLANGQLALSTVGLNTDWQPLGNGKVNGAIGLLVGFNSGGFCLGQGFQIVQIIQLRRIDSLYCVALQSGTVGYIKGNIVALDIWILAGGGELIRTGV